ncbi:MAG: hypothetical protein ACREBE_25505, partial [bacterium]
YAEGFSYVWLSGEPPGAIVSPKHPVASSSTTNAQVELIELASENGAGYWLDPTTGRQFVTRVPAQAPAHKTEAVFTNVDQRETELLSPIVKLLTERAHNFGVAERSANGSTRGFERDIRHRHLRER